MVDFVVIFVLESSRTLDLLHNLKIIEEFLGETKSSTAAYMLST
ncbi:hypothetical protein [Candidatus Tisiphia endosymbiont of Beris chalybata]